MSIIVGGKVQVPAHTRKVEEIGAFVAGRDISDEIRTRVCLSGRSGNKEQAQTTGEQHDEYSARNAKRFHVCLLVKIKQGNAMGCLKSKRVSAMRKVANKNPKWDKHLKHYRAVQGIGCHEFFKSKVTGWENADREVCGSSPHFGFDLRQPDFWRASLGMIEREIEMFEGLVL